MSHDTEYEIDYENLVPVWNYEEFSHLQKIENPVTNFARGYILDTHTFYIEAWFYTQMTRLFERFGSEKDKILNSFFALVKEAPFTLFTKDVNAPLLKDSKYRLLEIDELIHHTGLVFDDISRGSDYGD